jgi:hypothetical protein
LYFNAKAQLHLGMVAFAGGPSNKRKRAEADLEEVDDEDDEGSDEEDEDEVDEE